MDTASNTIATEVEHEIEVAAQGRHLPPEIWETILEFLFTCKTHRWASYVKPCNYWHEKPQLQLLLPLRLVCRYFEYRLTPPLFYQMIAKAPRHRKRMLRYFAESRLASRIQILHMEISPNDLGGKMRRVTQAAHIPANKKLMHYFEVLPMVLGPILRPYTSLRLLHLTTTYDGFIEKRLPRSEMLSACFDALVSSVRKSGLQLEEIQLGLPYENGYTNFFEDLDDSRYKRALRSLGVKSAGVKLYDLQGNFTTVQFF